jgi:hypothetical protein
MYFLDAKKNSNMLAMYMYLQYHKAGLTPTTPITSIAISPVKMSIGRKSLSNLHSEMIFLQGKPVFYIFLPSVNKQLKKAPQGYFCISTKQPEQITIIQYGNNTADIQS